MPSASTVRYWAIEDISGFSARYAIARDRQLESWADDIIDNAEDDSRDVTKEETFDAEGKVVSTKITQNHVRVARSRLIIDSKKWILSKLKPERYGTQIKVAGDSEHPIVAILKVMGSSALKPVPEPKGTPDAPQ